MEIIARDGPEVLPAARSVLLAHGGRTPLAAVLFHGLTNNPAQFAAFAPLLHERGVNVFVPRLPLHGYRDRLTTAIASLTAEMLRGTANEALDVACGLGERVAALGISMGALLAADAAQFRPIAVAVPVAPSFALLQMPHFISSIFGRVMLRLPNLFLWWDPRLRSSEPPITAYPRFSTHALMQGQRIGDAVYSAARRGPPQAQRIVTIVNPRDPAVNNRTARHVSSLWASSNPAGVAYEELAGLPALHDILDPQQPRARTDLVYPKLLQALGATCP